ncbi:MAG: serine/threonine protein kinase [Spirochaetales bacterium]|nr:serine/threonine protein kinase [Spirochaetales bacterium]
MRDGFFLDHLQAVESASGRYCNQRFLGKGGNGTAFLVTGVSGRYSGLQMVLKVFHKISDPVRKAAFLEEVKKLKEFDHPSIVRVFDDGVYNTHSAAFPFALMEYVPTTVRQLVLENRIDRVRALRIVLNCLSALVYIHGSAKPVVHRDIKPENILVNDSGAKLADFGLAKDLHDNGAKRESDDDEDDLPRHHTPYPAMPFRYRTPELVARAKDPMVQVNAQSDIFQLGTVLYELLQGFNPQREPEKITDPIELDVREIRGAENVALYDLLQDMLRIEADRRPTATLCLERLTRIHKSVCEKVTQITGENV